jgi:hypothetical protein
MLRNGNETPRLRQDFRSCPCSPAHALYLHPCRQRRRGTERQVSPLCGVSVKLQPSLPAKPQGCGECRKRITPWMACSRAPTVGALGAASAPAHAKYLHPCRQRRSNCRGANICPWGRLWFHKISGLSIAGCDKAKNTLVDIERCGRSR